MTLSCFCLKNGIFEDSDMYKTVSISTFLSIFLLVLGTHTWAQGYNLNGDAVALGGDCYRLTQSVNWQGGTVWYTDQLDLRQPFDIEFELYLGTNDGGADGIMFVIQTVGNNAIGYNGGGMGFGGFSPSLGIEFDTFQNTPSGDPASDHLAIQRDGNTDHNSPDNLAGPFPIPINIENGQNHHARVVWDPVNQNLDLYFKCIYVTQLNYNLVDSIFLGNPIVYWGFTASTGGLNNEQRVCVERNVLSVQDTFHICTGDTAQLQATGAGIGGTYSWAPNYFISNVNSQSPLAFPPQDTTYIVTFTDVCGGTEQDTVDVLVHDPPVFSLGADTTFCPGETVTLEPDTVWPSAAFLWSDNSSANTLDVSSNGLVWLEQDIFGCSYRDSLVASTISMPPFDLGPDQDKCPEDQLQLDVTQPGATYMWIDGTTNGSLTVNTPGTYWVDFSANGCTLRDSVVISDYASPTVPLPDNVNLCAGGTVLLDPQNPGFSYTWSTAATTPTLTVGSPGQYWVDFEDGNGCDGSDTVLVVEIPAPVIGLPADTSACDGETVVLDATQPGLSYNWSTGSTQSQISLTSSETISLTVTNADNCESTETVEVTFNPLPTIDLPEDTLICQDGTVILDPGNPTYTYSWSDGTNGSTLEVNAEGPILVDFTDVNGCQGSDFVFVSLVPFLEINLGEDLSVCGGDAILLDPDPTQTGTDYLWSTGDITPSLEVTETGTFWVIVSNECFSDSDTLNIEVQTEGGLFVPNAFTPNGDGLNDQFVVSALNVPDFEILIFNRWGREIFRSNNATNAWDGSVKGQPAPQGSYTYLIKYTNCNLEPDIRQGSITLIR